MTTSLEFIVEVYTLTLVSIEHLALSNIVKFEPTFDAANYSYHLMKKLLVFVLFHVSYYHAS
jgi:hypothetical protein